MFDIFVSDLFPIVDDKDFASYSNGNTIYCVSESPDDIILSLRYSPKKVFQRFTDKQMKGKTDNYHLVLSKNDKTRLELGKSLIKKSIAEKLLGVNIDRKLSFVEHVKNIPKKANSKLRALKALNYY